MSLAASRGLRRFYGTGTEQAKESANRQWRRHRTAMPSAKARRRRALAAIAPACEMGTEVSDRHGLSLAARKL